MSERQSFEDWLKEIDVCARKAGACEASESYVSWTGEDSWRDMYDDGLDPEEAWGEEEDAARSMM